MKYKATFDFDANSEMVWEAREKRFENPEQFPEMQKHEEIERKVDGKKIFSKRKIELAANVPAALRAILPSEMLKCIDTSEYNLETGEHKWLVKPTFKADVFKCRGYSKYTDFTGNDGQPKTHREIELEVTVNVPIFGKRVEEVILESYKKNLNRDNESISKMIAIMKQKPEA